MVPDYHVSLEMVIICCSWCHTPTFTLQYLKYLHLNIPTNPHLDNPFLHLSKPLLLVGSAKADHSADKVFKVLHLL